MGEKRISKIDKLFVFNFFYFYILITNNKITRKQKQKKVWFLQPYHCCRKYSPQDFVSWEMDNAKIHHRVNWKCSRKIDGRTELKVQKKIGVKNVYKYIKIQCICVHVSL